MAMNKSFLNVILLGFGFMFVFTAFQTMGNIQKNIMESIKQDDKTFTADAYTSLAIVYAVFALCNWFSPSVITLTGPRIAMIIGAITYMLFIMSFLIPKTWLLYMASAVIGAGAAIIWTAQGNYLTLNSTPTTMTRNSGIFWAMMQCSMFFGNLFVYIQFQGKTDVIDASTRTIVFWVLSAVSILGIGFLCILRPAVQQEDNEINVEAPGPVDAFKGAIKLFFTRDMLLLAVTFFYTGIELSFYSGVYGSAIGFTEKMPNAKQLIGMSGIFIGIGAVLGGGLFGILGKKTIRWGRSPIVVAGFVIHVIAFFLIFLNIPNPAPIASTNEDAFITPNPILAVFCSFLLGFGDSCFNTQIYSTLGGLFSSDSASAFAVFKFTQSVAAASCFFYASSLVLYWHLGILIVLATLGTITFCLVEWLARPSMSVPEQCDTADSDSNS